MEVLSSSTNVCFWPNPAVQAIRGRMAAPDPERPLNRVRNLKPEHMNKSLVRGLIIGLVLIVLGLALVFGASGEKANTAFEALYIVAWQALGFLIFVAGLVSVYAAFIARAFLGGSRRTRIVTLFLVGLSIIGLIAAATFWSEIEGLLNSMSAS